MKKTEIILDGHKVKYERFEWVGMGCDENGSVSDQTIILDGEPHNIVDCRVTIKGSTVTRMVLESKKGCRHDFISALRPTKTGFKMDSFCLKCRQWKMHIGAYPSERARMAA